MDEGRNESTAAREWPAWARIVVSLLIALQLVSVVAGALGEPPSSIVERAIADPFVPYFAFTYQVAAIATVSVEKAVDRTGSAARSRDREVKDPSREDLIESI